jgi:hypothetical protein
MSASHLQNANCSSLTTERVFSLQIVHILHNFLNVFVQLANTRGFKKKMMMASCTETVRSASSNLEYNEDSFAEKYRNIFDILIFETSSKPLSLHASD